MSRAAAVEKIPRRTEILAVAARCFAANGFEATTIRQISEGAGILSGSLYYHFETKDEILHELMRPFAGNLCAQYQALLSAGGTPEEMLERFIRFALTELTQKHDLHSILINDRKFFLRTPAFAYVVEYGNTIRAAWLSVLKSGQQAGAFRGDLDFNVAMPMILRSINATADTFDPAGPVSIAQVIDTQIKLLTRGVRA
jgi:AcrR family transcriptional regulator